MHRPLIARLGIALVLAQLLAPARAAAERYDVERPRPSWWQTTPVEFDWRTDDMPVEAPRFVIGGGAVQDTSAVQTFTMTAPSLSMPATHRYFRAYPGIPYEVPIVVTGGCYPFTFAVSNNPVDMTVTPYTRLTAGTTTGSWGYVRWVNPTTTATNVVFQATDNCGTIVSTTLTITVTTTGFKFVNASTGVAAASNGCVSSCGDGSDGAPWRTINDAYENVAAGDYLILRGFGLAARYDFTGIPTSGSCSFPTLPELRYEANEGDRWAGMIRDPRSSGEAVLDFGFSGTWSGCPNAGYHKVTGAKSWYDGLTLYRIQTKGIHHVPTGALRGIVFWRNICDTAGPAVDGANAACLMTQTVGGSGVYKSGAVVLANIGRNISNDDFLKTYDETLLVVADNSLENLNVGQLAIKGAHGRVELRENRITGSGAAEVGIGGNVAGVEDYEARYNLVQVSGVGVSGTAAIALHIGQGPNTIDDVKVYRNTFVGRIKLWGGVTWLQPVVFTRNVIINGDVAQATPYVCDGGEGAGEWGDCNGVGAPTITMTNNLTGASGAGIVDANGELQGTYLTDHGPGSATPKGHMLAGSAPAAGNPHRMPPFRIGGRAWCAELLLAGGAR